MCVAVAVNPGARLTHSEWDKCWTANPDGAGYAYIRRGKVIIERGLSRSDMWRRYFKDAQANPKSPFVIHFRIATHGNVCLDNTHPFVVDHAHGGGTVVAHNGIIQNVLLDLEPNESDTRAFIRLYLRHLPAGWMDNAAILELVESYIGASLMVILTTDKSAKRNLYILNESAGEWDGERWFSNDYWRIGSLLRGCSLDAGTYIYDKATKIWKRAVPVKERNTVSSSRQRRAAEVTDKANVAHRPWLPNGTLGLGGLDEDTLAQTMLDAIDAGYCERCLWKPCWCDGVCFDCTRPLDECDCGMELSCAAYYGGDADSMGMTWLDTNDALHPRSVMTARTPQSRAAADISFDDWMELERSFAKERDEWRVR